MSDLVGNPEDRLSYVTTHMGYGSYCVKVVLAVLPFQEVHLSVSSGEMCTKYWLSSRRRYAMNSVANFTDWVDTSLTVDSGRKE